MTIRNGALLHRSALFSRPRRVLPWLLCALLAAAAAIWLFSGVHAFEMDLEPSGAVGFLVPIHPGDEISHRYIHSVEKCPIIEKYTVTDKFRMELMESWNCSFGAGIAYGAFPEKGQTGELRDGYYIIGNIREIHREIYFRPFPASDHTMRAGAFRINLSDRFPNRLMKVAIVHTPRWRYLWYADILGKGDGK